MGHETAEFHIDSKDHASARRRRYVLIFLGVMLLIQCFASFVSAQTRVDASTANQMMPGCRYQVREAENNYFLQGLCMGMIMGLATTDDKICAPSAVTNKQLVLVVVQYVDNQPARHHEKFWKLALEALRKAWPC